MDKIKEYMQQFLDGGPAYNLIGFIGLVFGLFLAVYIPWWTSAKRKPTYFVKHVNLVENGAESYDSVSVLYGGKKVQNLSVARVALWNAGSQTIDKNDVAEKDKLRIKALGDVKLLGVKVLYQNEPNNDFHAFLAGKQKHIAITFDYFDKNQGVLIEVFHTGKSAEDIAIEGTIKGTKDICRIDGRPALLRYWPFSKRPAIKRRHRDIVSGVIFIIGIFMLWYTAIKDTSTNTLWEVILKYGLMMIFTLLYSDAARSLLLRKVPKGLAVIYNESY